MKRQWTAVAFVLGACGGTDGEPDAAGGSTTTQWTWSFRDATTGEIVGCPPSVDTIAISTWHDPSNIGHSCSDSIELQRKAGVGFACAAGGGVFPGGGYTRFDVITADLRVYARVDLDAQGLARKHVEITTPRGFVELTVARIDPVTMLERPCTSYEALDSPWLGPTQTIDCYDSPRTTIVLPGQEVGARDVEVRLQSHNRCEVLSTKRTYPVLLEADATAAVSAQL